MSAEVKLPALSDRWRKAAPAERSNAQLYLTELADALGVARRVGVASVERGGHAAVARGVVDEHDLERTRRPVGGDERLHLAGRLRKPVCVQFAGAGIGADDGNIQRVSVLLLPTRRRAGREPQMTPRRHHE